MTTKTKMKIYLLYLSLLSLGIFYINKVLHTDAVKVTQIDPPIRITEPKPIGLSINIITDTTSQIFNYNKTDTDTVEDLLESARAEGRLNYEKVLYTNKVVLEYPNKVPQVKWFWTITLDGNDLTNEFESVKLKDGKAYAIKLNYPTR